MAETQFPPCGIYRTEQSVAGIPADRLVYFHNHGDPGPGVYLPVAWKANRAMFEERGHLLNSPAEADFLVALPAQGLYRVARGFHCCTKECRFFEAEMLVQLGYDGQAIAILFTPELVEGGLALPQRGTRIDDACFAHLHPLKVAVSQPRHEGASPNPNLMH